MKVTKGLVTGFLASVLTLVTIGASNVEAQDYGRGAAAPRRERPGRPDRPGRAAYLGTTGMANKFRYESFNIYVGARQEFRGLQFVARDDGFDVRSITVYFRNGGSKSYGAVQLAENTSVIAEFRNSRFVQEVVVVGKTTDAFGSKAQLEVYGVR